MLNSVSSPTGKYKYFSLISSLYVTVLLLTMIVENRVVLIGGLQILSGTLVLPLSYAVSDIITEVYGYKQMRQLIWVSIIILYIAAFIVFVIMHLPSDPKNIVNSYYPIVLASFQLDIITYSIAALISLFLNSYLLSKWKVILNGRFFALRSLGSTMLGEAIFILIWGFLAFSAKFSFFVLLKLMLASYIYKVIYNLIAIVPCALVASTLKRSENMDVYDTNVNFNPFRWKVQ